MSHMSDKITVTAEVELDLDEVLDEIGADMIVDYYSVTDLLEQMEMTDIAEWMDTETAMSIVCEKIEEAPIDAEEFGDMLGHVMTKTQAIEMCKALFDTLKGK